MSLSDVLIFIILLLVLYITRKYVHLYNIVIIKNIIMLIVVIKVFGFFKRNALQMPIIKWMGMNGNILQFE